MSDWTDEMIIETPEQIDLHLELAGPGSRLLARLYDWWIQLLLTLLLGLMAWLSVLGAAAAGGTGGPPDTFMIILFAGLLAFWVLLQLGYDIYFEVRSNGQTPGKRQTGIRVVRAGGAPVDLTASAVRNVLRYADMLPTGYLLGGTLVLLSKRAQRLGDLAAGTVVVRERVAVTLDDDQADVEQLASPAYAFSAAQLAKCGPDARTVVRSFFRRYRTLPPPARGRLANTLAERYAGLTGLSMSTGQFPEEGYELPGGALAYLASLLRDLDRHARHG